MIHLYRQRGWWIAILSLVFGFPFSFSFLNNNHPQTQTQQSCAPCRRPLSYRTSNTPLHVLEQPPETSHDNNSQQLNITPLLQLTGPSSTPPSSSPSSSSSTPSLEERTRNFLNSKTVGSWTRQDFEEAQTCIQAWANRQSRRAALMVERIIHRVVQEPTFDQYNTAGCLDMALMYTCAVQGWANSWEKGAAAQRAEEILDTMQLRYMDGDERIQPPIECFNFVLLAYARSGLPDAPQQAMRVLEKLQDWHSAGQTTVVPNQESYATVLRAFAKTGKPEAPAHVKRLLQHLEELAQKEGYNSVRPNYLCHGAYIGALMDAMDRDYITGEEAAEEAEAYLLELLASPYPEARPDAWAFAQVLSAWSKSGSLQMLDRAEALMKTFEEYHKSSDYSERTKPTTSSYNCLIACYGRSFLGDKGEKAHQILNRMKELSGSGNDTSVRPDAVTYNTVMNAYAKSKQSDAPYKVEQLLREMHQVYEETGDRRVRPNSRSFNTCVSIIWTLSVWMSV
jgi:hypothetical protein